jgi:hypothetical protein
VSSAPGMPDGIFAGQTDYLGIFWSALEWKMSVYFMVFWNILHVFGIFMVFWNILHVFGIFYGIFE